MSAPAPIQIGRYVLHDVIASGGMASVHFGRLVGPAGFSKTVAIKRLHRPFARMPSFREMILEEGRLAARIRHPNVVPPLDVLAEGGELLLVMEYVHGESLSKLCKAAWAHGERVPLSVAAALFAQVLHGLHAAHEARDETGKPLDIVHRDVSPQNVIVGTDGQARVIDFGIAKAVTSGEHTSTGTIKGKVPYLAPEQLEGEQATRRTDVWAAAVCFWELLANRRLFTGEDDSETLRQIMEMPIPAPSTLNESVPRQVDEIVLHALDRDPNRRFPTAREMAVAIETTMPLATATQVGAWAERLAAVKLGERAATLARVEQTPADIEIATTATPTPGPSSRSMPASGSGEHTMASPRPADSMGAPRTSYSPHVDMVGALPPSALRAVGPPAAGPQATVGDVPPTISAPNARIMTGRISAPPTTLAPPSAGMLRKPALEIANVDWLPPPSPEVARAQKASRKGRAFPWLIGFLLLALVGLWIAAPFLVRQAVVSAAAKHGLTVTIDRVDVSRRAVRLADVRVESTELPGIVAHANVATIELRRLVPDRVVVDDLDLRLDGAAPFVVQTVDAWRAAHDAGVRETFSSYTGFSVTSGRIEWRDPVGAGSSFVLENVTLDVAKNGARLFGDDWHFNSPLVTVRAGAAQAGAWQLDAERSGVLTRGVVRFDPTLTSAASMSWSSSDDGAVTLGFNVPIAPLSELHVPGAILGTLATDRSRVEAHGEIALVTTAQGGKVARIASGRIVVAAGSLAVFPGGQPVDVSMELPVAGDPSQPIAIGNGTLSVAPADPNGVSSTAVASAKLAGKIEVATPKIELAGTTTPIPCAKGTTALAFQLAFAFDKLAQTKLSLAPTAACPPKLK